MKTKIIKKFTIFSTLIILLLSACSMVPEAIPATPEPVDEVPILPSETLLVPTREIPDKIDKLTPVAPIGKEPIDMTPISPADLPANLQDVVSQATSELAEKLSIDSDKIQVIEAKSVVWSDSSLGCPQPGMNYLMVLTNGYRVVLAVDEQPYYYHANQRGYGLFCDDPSPPYSEGAVDR
jgi:hypothetical protein